MEDIRLGMSLSTRPDRIVTIVRNPEGKTRVEFTHDDSRDFATFAEALSHARSVLAQSNRSA